jgi:hypothetical protein
MVTPFGNVDSGELKSAILDIKGSWTCANACRIQAEIILGQCPHGRLGRKQTVMTRTRLLWLRIMFNATLGSTKRVGQKVSLKHIILRFYITIPDIKNLLSHYFSI